MSTVSPPPSPSRDPHAGRRARTALWRHARRLGLTLCLLFGFLMAQAPAAETGGARVVSEAPVQARLAHLGRLAERSPLEARRLLLAEAPLFAGAPYPSHLAYLRLLRRTHLDAGQLRAAYAIDERLIALATAMDDHRNIALASLGRVHRHLNENDPAAAMALLETLSGRYRAAGGAEFEAGADFAYGAIYHIMGQHDRALGHYLHCLELLGRHPGLWSPREADVRLALGRLYVNSGNAAKALETTAAYRAARRAQAVSRDADAGEPTIPARAQAALHLLDGRAHVALKQLPQAHAAFERALALARRHELRALQAHILGNIADAWLKGQRYREAEAAARAAIPIAEEVAERGAAQIAYANLGLALFGQGRTAEGVGYIDRTAAELRKGGAMPVVAMLLEEQAAALEKAGQFRQALQAMRERELLRDALASERRNKAFAAQQEQFNAKERAAQIERLRHENAAKDAEIENRKLRFGLASFGALLAGLLAVVVFILYRKSQATSHRLAQLNAELAYRSARDPLTGLFNRRSFAERMRERGDGAAELAGDCFILLDIDHFKRINDRHGHAAGDAVLVEVGRRLSAAVRESDMALRWGGEEFLVHSRDVAPAQRPQLVRRILDAIAATQVSLADGSLLTISATAGAVALPLPSSRVAGWEGAVALADRALYKGKEAGRNRGFIVEDVVEAGAEPGLKMQLVLPEVAWQAA